MTGFHRSRRARLLVAIMLTAMLLGTSIAGCVATASGRPILTSAAMADLRGGVTLAGEGFTPGGTVSVAIGDHMGAKADETFSTIASSGSSAINFEPGLAPEAHPIAAAAIDFLPGLAPEAHPVLTPLRSGTISVTFTLPCRAGAMARADDARTGAWSNWLTVAPGC